MVLVLLVLWGIGVWMALLLGNLYDSVPIAMVFGAVFGAALGAGVSYRRGNPG